MSGAEVVLIVVSIFFPPLAVLIQRGCGVDLIINILLTILGHCPGVIHAIYLILKDRKRRKQGQLLYPGGKRQQQQQNNDAMYGQGPYYGSKDVPPSQPVYREVPVKNDQDPIQSVPPTYGDYTEQDIAGRGPAPVQNEKYEYAPVATPPEAPRDVKFSTKEV